MSISNELQERIEELHKQPTSGVEERAEGDKLGKVDRRAVRQLFHELAAEVEDAKVRGRVDRFLWNRLDESVDRTLTLFLTK